MSKFDQIRYYNRKKANKLKKNSRKKIHKKL